jgi:hypothetical protein
MFPVGIPPQARDENRDERGLDTINRLLLHGARYHHRPHLFVAPSDVDEGRDIPDWEADRISIRVGLALHEELSLQPGDCAALFMPLSISWALVERGLWGLGATSVPIPPNLPDSDVSRVLAKVRPKILFVSSAGRASPLYGANDPTRVPRLARGDLAGIAGGDDAGLLGAGCGAFRAADSSAPRRAAGPLLDRSRAGDARPPLRRMGGRSHHRRLLRGSEWNRARFLC